ncbi:MAG: polyphenol oxidase family protein [Treponema sp.]|nr:polyphenol oxidase family protein [Treponema sp.]
MVNFINVSKGVKPNDVFVKFPFYMNGLPYSQDAAKENGFKTDVLQWGMTLRGAGSMRFRWKECNPNRDSMLKEIAAGKKVVPVELIHSKIVFNLDTGLETQGMVGDGLVTLNHKLMPVVTVADCVPIYFYDPSSGALGIVHSGWKGTGIIGLAIERAKKLYGLNTETTMTAIGPHIGSCCYFVDDERAAYFKKNFCEDSIEIRDGRNMLDLTRANLSVIQRAGIKESNIVVAQDCTACDEIFGSFRREAAFLPSGVDKMRAFTVQAAFVV